MTPVLLTILKVLNILSPSASIKYPSKLAATTAVSNRYHRTRTNSVGPIATTRNRISVVNNQVNTYLAKEQRHCCRFFESQRFSDSVINIACRTQHPSST